MKTTRNATMTTVMMSFNRVVTVGVFLLLSLFVLQFVIATPAHGTKLSVETTPEGLPVVLDGQEVGEAPQEITLSAGEHQLDVTHQTFSWSGLIQLSGDAELTIAFSEKSKEAPYRTVILSKPGNAQVIVDGEPRGRTPWSGELSRGEHTLKLFKKGFEEWTARLTPNSNFSLRGILTTKKSKQSTPSETGLDRLTKVMPVPQDSGDKDGDNLEKIMGGNTEQGFWVASGRDEMDDTSPTKTAKLIQEKQSRSTPKSEPKPTAPSTKKESSSTDKGPTVPLKIWSNPSGATVYIDGKKVGKTPFIRPNYPAGKAVITLKKSGFGRWQDEFQLSRPTSLKISL
jgi:hypothetical protein